jgi:heme-degrading monooxygenase HmoA
LRDVRKPGRIFLLTRWVSRAHFQAYLRSDDFKNTHKNPHAKAEAGGFYQLELIPC